MKKSVASMLVGAGVVFLLLGVGALPASAQIPVSACGTLGGNASYILTADLVSAATCITINGNGATIDLNGHSIRGVAGPGGVAGISSSGNNHTIKGPGIIFDFSTCLSLTGTSQLVMDVLVYNCTGGNGFVLGDASKCVQCRAHDVRVPGATGVGIRMGLGCILESSIVRLSDNGAVVGGDCKIWDLVIDTVLNTGLTVAAGTTVSRTVISHYGGTFGLIYNCTGSATTAQGCQDSSNSVSQGPGGVGASIGGTGPVITDCATNNSGIQFIPATPAGQCV